jgi:hypothetical protein
MALLQESYLRNLAIQNIKNDRRYDGYSSTTDSIRKSKLLESSVNFSAGKRDFDIFLSHSFSDKELVLGLKIELERFGYSVYVDWIEDYGINRYDITKNNVFWIQYRMKSSKCLLYATSEHATDSRWMPWETGYMDGYTTGKVAIIPVVAQWNYDFKGSEYLGIYPRIEKAKAQNSENEFLWVHDQEDNSLYVRFDLWLNGQKPTKH